jgi:hypothetical protein
MVDIGRPVRPLIGARQRAHRVMLMEAEGRYTAQLHLLSQHGELRRIDLPLVERGLQRRRNPRSVRRPRQIFGNNNKTAITCAVFQCGEFHQCYLLILE